MNEELKAKLLSYLDGLEKAASKAGEFAEVEIPQTIREYLLWQFWEASIWAAISLAFAMLMVFFGRRFGRMTWDKMNAPGICGEESGGWFALSLVSRVVQVAAIFPFLAGVVPNTVRAVKVSVAPRVVLIEDAAKFIGVNKPAAK